MSWFMNNLMGESINEPNGEKIESILSELENADNEHADVSLTHETGWCLSVFWDKFLVWENVEDSSFPPKEVTASSWEEVFNLLSKVSRGEISEVNEQVDGLISRGW